MSEQRIAAAVIVLLSLVYLRFSMPRLYEESLPALKDALGAEQVALPVSERVAAWLSWD